MDSSRHSRCDKICSARAANPHRRHLLCEPALKQHGGLQVPRGRIAGVDNVCRQIYSSDRLIRIDVTLDLWLAGARPVLRLILDVFDVRPVAIADGEQDPFAGHREFIEVGDGGVGPALKFLHAVDRAHPIFLVRHHVASTQEFLHLGTRQHPLCRHHFGPGGPGQIAELVVSAFRQDEMNVLKRVQ